MSLLIIRHAESVENATKYSGFYVDPRPYDGPAAHNISRDIVGLTPRGFQQAQWLGDVLPAMSKTEPHVYTSTYRRAIDTATVALPHLLDGWPKRTALLDEQHYGDATYMAKRELFATYPDLADDRRNRKHIWIAPGGESLADGVNSRAAGFIDLVRSELQGQRFVIAITHQTMAVALQALLERRALAEILIEEKERKIPNAAILQYDLIDHLFSKTTTVMPPI